MNFTASSICKLVRSHELKKVGLSNQFAMQFYHFLFLSNTNHKNNISISKGHGFSRILCTIFVINSDTSTTLEQLFLELIIVHRSTSILHLKKKYLWFFEWLSYPNSERKVPATTYCSSLNGTFYFG